MRGAPEASRQSPQLLPSAAAADEPKLVAASHHSSSAGPAPESRQAQQAPPEGSRPLTPAQHAVALVLMVVLKRAAKEGSQGVSAAKHTLACNNPSTRPFLALIPNKGSLPSFKAIQQEVSPELNETLTLLADQCASAGCQSLEVFTWSLQRKPHWGERLGMAADGGLVIRRGAMEELYAALKPLREKLQYDAWSNVTVRDLGLLGVRRGLACLMISILALIEMHRELGEERGAGSSEHRHLACLKLPVARYASSNMMQGSDGITSSRPAQCCCRREHAIQEFTCPIYRLCEATLPMQCLQPSCW